MNDTNRKSAAAAPPGTLPFTFSTYLGDPTEPISTASFDAPSVTVLAGGSATVNANIAVDPFFINVLGGRTLYGGWITFTPRTDGQTYRVPVVGFAGDYQGIVAMPTLDLGGGFQIRGSLTISSTCFRPTKAGRGG